MRQITNVRVNIVDETPDPTKSARKVTYNPFPGLTEGQRKRGWLRFDPDQLENKLCPKDPDLSNVLKNMSSQHVYRHRLTFKDSIIDKMDLTTHTLAGIPLRANIFTGERIPKTEPVTGHVLYVGRDIVYGNFNIRSDEPECHVCMTNGLSAMAYTSHSVRDENGRIKCPILLSYRCPFCNVKGYFAKPSSNCPMKCYRYFK